MVKIAAKKDSESYSVISQGSELYLSGFLTYDSAKNVINLLKNNPEVKTVNLNLTGGHLYEARKLSKYLAQQQYSTHVDDQCHANCLITYLGGQKRTAADTAQFSFHHRHGYENGYRSDWTIIKEQEKDRLYFQARGVYEKSTYMLYYKQSNDSDLALSAADLSNYNIVNSIQ
jgi:hypothetical protein